MPFGGLEIGYKPMRRVSDKEYRHYLSGQRSVQIEDVEVELRGTSKIDKLGPEDYKPETFNVWSFPDRGNWATHIGNYRGNWSPFIPRNLIMKFSNEGDLVLDQMMGSGTTLVECKLLNRGAIGIDVNPNAVMVALDRLNFSPNPIDPEHRAPDIAVYEGDARNLNEVDAESVDLIATHPPYASIIPYSAKSPIEGDLSKVHDIKEYISEMRSVADESFRVLKPDRHCAILIGDTRRKKHHVPIAFRVMQAFLQSGFVLREDIIKIQWNMKTTREKWRGSNYDFYLLGHEHLFVFRKPSPSEKPREFKESMRWWS